jgi:hypothetical protein
MSTGKKKVWSSRDSWRSVAFGLYRESGQWRYLLELNPSFDIRYQPAPGVELPVSGVVEEGKSTPKQGNNPGTLKQVDINLDLRRSSAMEKANQAPGIFPWATFEGYSERLGEYTALALLSPDRTNGFSLDSPQASSDSQRG